MNKERIFDPIAFGVGAAVGAGVISLVGWWSA